MAASDTDILNACLRGESDAWSQLIARYERLVYSVARAVSTDPDDCADVFQYVWMECFERLQYLRNVQSLPAWLITVTRRQAFAVLRSRKPNIPIEDCDEPAVDSKVAVIVREHAVERSLGQLPERCRLLLKLLYFDPNEPSYADIANHMGMPLASLGPTRARCLDKLRKLMES